jgi:hypothetical protein
MHAAYGLTVRESVGADKPSPSILIISLKQMAKSWHSSHGIGIHKLTHYFPLSNIFLKSSCPLP